MLYQLENELTKYLLDLRSYRPKCIQDFFVDLRLYYKANPILRTLEKTENVEGLIYLLKIVDEVYLFRNGHWQFVQKYIMSNTKYAFETIYYELYEPPLSKSLAENPGDFAADMMMPFHFSKKCADEIRSL